MASFAGNPALTALPEARVLAEIRPEVGGAEPLPGVVLSEAGRGVALTYNWIVWLSGETAVRDLLDEGLGYALARKALLSASAYVRCSAGGAPLRQPDPLSVTCFLYSPDASAQARECELRLLGERGRCVAGPTSVRLRPRSAEGASVAMGDGALATRGLADGTYTLCCSCDGAVTAARVELNGQLWAALVADQPARSKRLAARLTGTLGDYDSEPRTPEGRVDIPRLIRQITLAHMDTYDWLIWHAPTDWDDLHAFLPVARRNGIKVWVTLCPPSEQGGSMPASEPFRLDFIRWAEEVGKLAREHPNLAALVIDDFFSGSNGSLFTPDYIARVAQALRAGSPDVAFLPTLYWSSIGDTTFIPEYGPAVDGIVFPYSELQDVAPLKEQLAAWRARLGPDKLLMVNIYASGSDGRAEPGPRTEAYMREVLTISHEMADGIRIYCLPKEDLLGDARYAVTAELYGQWERERLAGRR